MTDETSWLKRIFSRSAPQKKQLEGRIKVLQHTASNVLAQLTSAKTTLKESVTDKVSPYVERLVAPLVRDVQHINRFANKSTDEVGQVQAMEMYQQWIEQAEQWMQFLSAQHQDRKALERSIITRSLQVTRDDITNDLKVIRDYCKHRFAELEPNLNKEDKVVLRRLVNNKIARYMNALRKIRRSRSTPESLDELTDFTENLRSQREKNFNRALSHIDHITHPDNASEKALSDERENLVVNFLEIADLETAVPRLLHDIENKVFNQDHLREHLIVLESEAIELQQELDLTPELGARFAHVLSQLHTARLLLEIAI